MRGSPMQSALETCRKGTNLRVSKVSLIHRYECMLLPRAKDLKAGMRHKLLLLQPEKRGTNTGMLAFGVCMRTF
jgi:hypothetical protein